MKKIIIGLFLISLCLSLGNKIVMPQAYAQETPLTADTRVSYFYASLQPYGEWIWNDTYGWVWSPYNLAVNWRPYTDGHWVYTDYGWTWASDQPWGWACFHYGRWFYDKNSGWLWYPDTVWAPSWVQWRTGDDMIGWAPLPPKAVWMPGRGLEFQDADAEHISWHAYSFCRAGDFTREDLPGHFITHARNVTIIKQTNITANTIVIANNQVVSQLPFHDMIVKAVGRPILRLKIAMAESPERHGVSGSEFRVFRPEISVKTVLAAVTPLMPEPAELKRRHDSEMTALQEMHKNRQRELEDEHAREIKNPPPGITKERLAQQHKVENNAMQEQMERERQLLQSQHARETRMAASPKMPPQRHISVSAPGPGNNEKGRGEGRPESSKDAR